MTMIENEHFNCAKMLSCKVMIIKTQKGYRWYQGHWVLLGVFGPLGGIRGCMGCIGGLAGSVDTQGPEGYRWHKGTLGAPRQCWWLSGGVRVYWGLEGSVGTQEQKGRGDKGGIWGLLAVLGPLGDIRGVRGVLGLAGSVRAQGQEGV